MTGIRGTLMILWCALAILCSAPELAVAQIRDALEPAPSVAALPVGGSEAFHRAAFLDAPAPRERRDPWLAMDKAKHVGGSLLLTLSAQYVLVVKADWSESRALPISAGSAAVVGIGKEVYDRYAGPTRYFSRKDLVADAVGILLGVGIVLI